MKKLFLYTVLVLLMPSFVLAVTQRVLIRTSGPDQIRKLAADGRLDILRVHRDGTVECFADDKVAGEYQQGGYKINVKLADAPAYYRQLMSRMRGGKYGFGPYYTYPQANQKMDSLHLLYPSLVAAKESLGVSREGKTIYGFSLTNAPADKPGVLFTGQHHAREPFGCNMAIEFARYLCQHYGTDSLVTHLVNNRQFWFVPVVNVDGSVYNSDTSADGMWRKNRRNNGDGTFGVDINRNYPYMWGYDDVGSSPTPSSDVYRGPSAGSEPEIQAVMNLMTDKGFFRTALNYHTYSNLLVLPWGYNNQYPVDSAQIVDLAVEATSYNGFTWGTAIQTVGYGVNGTSDDWMLETDDKPWKCLAMTPEVGAIDFYEPDNVPAQIAENLMPNLLVSEAADVYLEGSGIQVSDPSGNNNGIADPGETVNLAVPLKNKAVFDTARNVSATVTTGDPYLSITTPASAYSDLNPRQTKSNGGAPFVVQVAPGCPVGHVAALALAITADGGYRSYYPFTVKIGLTTGFNDNVEDTAVTNYYTAQSQWHRSTRASYSPSHSWYCGDEATGQYSNGLNASLTTPEFGLGAGMTLSFWHKYDVESGYDYCYVEYTTNGGSSWTPLDTFNGTQGAWTQQTYALSALPAGPMKLRFRFTADGGVTAGGWYLDDIRVGAPPVAELSSAQVSPAAGDTSTLFSYSVLYKSLGNHAPAESTVVIDGAPHGLARISGTYTAGATYRYQTKLAAGIKAAHQYYFQFITQGDTLRLPDTGAVTGPAVYDLLQTHTYTNDTDYAIPDNTPAGVWSYITVADSLTIMSIRAYVYIAHTYIGDLRVALRGPGWAGDSITLHNKSGGGADSLIGWYPTTLTPVQSLNGFVGRQGHGQWGLHVADLASTDVGTLRQWRLELTAGTISGITSRPDPAALPAAYALGRSYPNPSSGRATINYQLPQAAQVELRVYNVSGQLVRTLVSALRPAGTHAAVWDGRDAAGKQVSSGVYLYRLVTPDYSRTSKISLVR